MRNQANSFSRQALHKNQEDTGDIDSVIPDEDFQVDEHPPDQSQNLNYYTDMAQNQTSGIKLSIDDLEQQFDFLHGNGNYLRGE